MEVGPRLLELFLLLNEVLRWVLKMYFRKKFYDWLLFCLGLDIYVREKNAKPYLWHYLPEFVFSPKCSVCHSFPNSVTWTLPLAPGFVCTAPEHVILFLFCNWTGFPAGIWAQLQAMTLLSSYTVSFSECLLHRARGPPTGAVTSLRPEAQDAPGISFPKCTKCLIWIREIKSNSQRVKDWSGEIKFKITRAQNSQIQIIA